MSKLVYKPTKELKSIFGEIEFEIGGKVYTKDKIDNRLFIAMTKVDSEESRTIDELVISLIGEDNFEKDGPFNPLEVLKLVEWLNDVISDALGTKKKEEKVNKEEELEKNA